METTQILGLGVIVVDRQMIVEEYPVADTKIEALEGRIQIGGPVPTALTLLRRFGHQCRFAGLWGDDEEGRLIERDLVSQQITFPAQCRRSELRTGNAHVWVDRMSGTRTVVCHRGEPESHVVQELQECCEIHAVLHLDGWPGDAAVELARRTRNAGGLVVLDAGSPKERTEELLSAVDIVNAPRRFLSRFFGNDHIETGGRRLLESGAKIVTVTDGIHGAWIFTRDGICHYQPAFPVNVADSTGAGDVFTGGLIHAALQNWPADRIVRFASACAALKCQRMGNRETLPGLEEVERLLEIPS